MNINPPLPFFVVVREQNGGIEKVRSLLGDTLKPMQLRAGVSNRFSNLALARLMPAAQGMYQFSSTGGATIFVAVVGVLVGATVSIKPVFYTSLLLAVINFLMILTCLRITDQDVTAVEGK